jgi:class 3 adenylate cyclase
VAEKPSPPSGYRPSPIDTSSVELDPHLLQLTEKLSEHTHDLWAQLRLAQGWTYGPVRDDARKRHPCLVPYRDLPDSEKDHDRNTALGTVRALLAIGMSITPRTELVADVVGVSADELVTEGSRLIGGDSPFLAYEVLSEGLLAHPGHLRLRQLAAHALTRAGGLRGANEQLRKLYEEGHRDDETLSLLARTHKDLALTAATPRERQEHLARAFELYHTAFSRTGNSYPGVNAATMALLLGDGEKTRSLARKAATAARKELKTAKRKRQDCYWLVATLAEAALLLDQKQAATLYREAIALAGDRPAHLASTRRNARLILEAMAQPPELIETLIPAPRVVVFTGHMIDRPGRTPPRFPPGAEEAVRSAIETRLDGLGAGIGFASAASGGDIIFLEAMRRRGGKINIVLPYPEPDFIPGSVLVSGTGEWVGRFESVLSGAESVRRAVGQRFTESAVFFEYTNLLLLGLARLRSARLDVELVPLALWDGKTGGGAGGTGATVEEWRSQGFNVEVINLASIVPSTPAAKQTDEPAAPTAEAVSLETRIMAVLFADVVNFSKLTEAEIPRFVEHFLGSVGRLARESRHAPVVSNTWGDGLYFVFNSVADAGEWALSLCEMAANTDWTAVGLRKDLNLRVALHAGPLFTVIDPVTNQRNYTGKQVVPAARLEPVTPPGLVYASEEFAAIAAATRVMSFSCQPVGKLGLAKGAGSLQVYHVRRVKGEE